MLFETTMADQPGNEDVKVKRFVHTPLKSSFSSIRLANIQPNGVASTVECELAEVTFGDRPKYAALSYCWGSDAACEELIVNGEIFFVRPNLSKAMRNLRRSNETVLIWIDALCINQADIEERNQQLRLMPYIYGRAREVFVWLGDESSTMGREGLNLMTNLCERDYWRRVWIVQEIGKARRIKIFYDSGREIEWDDFITRQQRECKLKGCVPVKIAAQIEKKHTDGQRLQNLLESHQEALCAEPRDKIYGFVGLAADVHGKLPLDYGKSLFEIYKDVMCFSSGTDDMVHFSKVVISLLGGRDLVGSSYLDHLSSVQDSEIVTSGPQLLKVPGWVTGKIIHLGPSYNEIMSQPEKSSEWTLAIQTYLGEISSSYEMSRVFKENDAFMERLEGLEDWDARRIFSFDRKRTWDATDAHEYEDLDQVSHRPSPTMSGSRAQSLNIGPAYEGLRLGLLWKRITHKQYVSAICLLPAKAREGNYICQFPEHDLAAVVDIEVGKASKSASIIGCAGLAKDSVGLKGEDTVTLSAFSNTSSDLDPYFLEAFYVDITTLYEISC